MHTKFLLENLKDNDNLEDLTIDWKILKQVLYKQDWKILQDLSDLMKDSVPCS
jgi:hypothetical protein